MLDCHPASIPREEDPILKKNKADEKQTTSGDQFRSRLRQCRLGLHVAANGRLHHHRLAFPAALWQKFKYFLRNFARKDQSFWDKPRT